MHNATPSANSREKTFGEACDAFLEDLSQAVADGRRSAATLAMHTEHVRLLCGHIPPGLLLARMSDEVISSAAVREARGRRRRPDGEARRNTTGTVAKRVCTLRLVLKAARRRRWIERLPEFPEFEGLRRPRNEHLRDAGELERLCDRLSVERADWLYVAVFTGMHPGDVERLAAYTECDPFAKVPWFLRRNTKNKRPPRVMVMPTPLAKRLREVFERRQLTPGAAVVEPWDKDARSKTLRRLGAKLGLLVRRATDMRHTCATWAAHELGAITPGLQEWVGHSDGRMLHTTYVHALPPALEDVARALSRAARRPPLMKVPSLGGRRRGAKRKGPGQRANAAGAESPNPGAPSARVQARNYHV